MQSVTRIASGAALFAIVGLLASAASERPGHWFEKAAMPLARTEAAVAILGSRIYAIGGFGPQSDQRAVQVYDVKTDTWSLGPPLPAGVNHAGAVGLHGKLYVIGGFLENGGATDACYLFDPTSGVWRRIASLPSARGSPSVAVLDGKIHAVGGNDRGSLPSHDVYDPATDSWGSRAGLPLARDHMALAEFGGKLYALGGRVNSYAHNTSETDVYDPALDRWTRIAPMPTARSGIAAAVLEERILVIGGESPRGVFDQNEAYDPATDSWAVLPPLPAGRHGTGAAVFGDHVYLPGGGAWSGGSQPTATLWVYGQ